MESAKAPKAAAEPARDPRETAQLGGPSSFVANPENSELQVSPARWRPARRGRLEDRAHDLYETPASAVRALLRTGELDRHRGKVWECAAGRGAIARELTRAGFDLAASDICAYEGADCGIDTPVDFLLEHAPPPGVGFICTNPPFRSADAFIRHGLALGLPVIVLLRLMALEGERRSDLIDRHLRRVWLGRERPPQMHRDGWAGPRTISATAPFAWFVFEPSESGGEARLRRISWREPGDD